MGLEHYVAALLAIAALNWGGSRFASRQANKLAFLATAGMPIVLWIGLMGFLLARDGVSAFQGRYFSIMLMMVGGFTVLTAASALIGQALGRFSSKGRP
jgi:hypothetical protein